MKLSEKIHQHKPQSLLQQAALHFNTSYDYVRLLAAGHRKGSRGKGKEIREWLEKEIEKRERKKAILPTKS